MNLEGREVLYLCALSQELFANHSRPLTMPREVIALKFLCS